MLTTRLHRLIGFVVLAAALVVPAATARPLPYAGKQLQPRDAVALVASHWPNSKVKATATMIAESQLWVGAWHDNFAQDGTLLSRDCGLYQINISGSKVGTAEEDSLRYTGTDPPTVAAVSRGNVDRAYKLWTAPWTRDGKSDYRRWQAWVAYTTGWAMFREAWVWSQIDDGVPGPWVATGRYLHKAVRAVANWYLLIKQDMNADQALAEARRLAMYWGAKGELRYSARLAVYWVYPVKPTAPPSDGLGPRPVVNNGY